MPRTRCRRTGIGAAYALPVLILMLVIACPQTARSTPTRSGTATFTARAARDTLFVLPVTWVVLDSVRVYRNGELQGELVDWRVVEPGNRIWIYRPLAAAETLRVDYVYQPFPLYRTHARRSLRELGRTSPPADTAGGPRIAAAADRGAATPEEWSRLQKSGSLIRSVQVGTNQDLALESALNLQIEGRVGRNVDVVAALTDQSTPIQPEGTTETLNELEKVFVSVRSPHVSATLGDYTLELPGGLYDTYSRKLTGVMAQGNLGTAAATASAAVSRGEFHTNSFSGREANQGPYPLAGKNGEIGILVLAGTERVWLDGEALRRGEGNDYVIDYAAGEVVFTSRRLITADSRIVVDFEYAGEDFERFYGAARSQAAFITDRFSATATVLTESDDRNRPLGLALTPADRAALRDAGDDPALAVSFAADSVGPGRGDYVRRDTTLAPDESVYSIFVFSPRDSNRTTGEWRVLFDDFGIGAGDYEAAADPFGLVYFHWVGPNRGRYRPFRRLPLPERHAVGDVRVHTTPVVGLTLSGEVAGSQRDINTFSSNGDADNDGLAGTAQASFGRDNPQLFGWQPHRIDANVRVRRRDERFVEIARASEIEFNRDWDVARNAGTEETIRETSLRLAPWRFLSVNGGYGDLLRPNQSSFRRDAGVTLNAWQRLRIVGSHVDLESTDRVLARKGDWIRQRAQANGVLGRFAPRGGVERERRRNRLLSGYDGSRFFEYHSGVAARLPYNLAADAEYRRRLYDVLDSGNRFHPSSQAYTASSELQWRPPEGGTTLLRYAHRERQYNSPDTADVVSDVGRLETLIVPRSRVFEGNVVYELAKSQAQNQILVAIQVPAGTGSYRREGDRFVPDDQGDYILVPRNTGDFSPATELTVNTLLWLRPDELDPQSASAWIRALSAETEFQMEERTRHALSPRLALLDQSLFRSDSTLQGTLSLRQDVHVRRLSQKFAVRLRYRTSASLQNQYLNGGQERTTREGAVRVRARYLAFLRGETEASVSREKLAFVSATFSDRDIDRYELGQDNTLTLSRIWTAGLGLRAAEVSDEMTRTQVSLRELRPHSTYSLHARGRLDAEVIWIHASSNRATVPFELGRGANRGENFRWMLRGTYQFGQNFAGSMSYTGRSDARERTVHTGRLEVRATL